MSTRLDPNVSPRRLRVALLHNIISPHVVPLFERLALQPGISLKVYFLAESDRNRRWATAIDRKFAYEVLPNWAIRLGRKDLYTFFINPTIASALIRDRFDVLISVGWDSFASQAAFILCKVLGRPYILWSGSTANEPSWRRTITRPIVKAMVGGSAGWIAYGTRARDYMATLGADPSRVAIAYNTVDVDGFAARADALRPQRALIRRELGIGDGPTILYVGQLIERKGALDLLEAHRILLRSRADAQLLLVGYGPLEAELRRRIDADAITGVKLCGHVAIPDLPRYYVAADCLAAPSHEEVWGLVLNEAAACGLPLVTAEPVGAAPDLVIPGTNGYVIPPRDPVALADALNRALDSSEKMGAASRSIISRMTYDQNVEAIVTALRRVTRASFVPVSGQTPQSAGRDRT